MPQLGVKRPRGTLADRLARRIDKSGGPDACWPWIGSRKKNGYGQIGAGGRAGRMLLTHRVTFELLIGRTLAWEECVLHRCDNPPCCNPNHLFLGDRQINVDDMMTKGRDNARAGSTHGMAKLTDDQVVEIRAAYSGTRGDITRIANGFGVSWTTVWEIVHRMSWRHI